MAVISTVLACIVVFVQILIDASEMPPPNYQNPTVASFALGFGAILFAFGGSSAYPTIQNDMTDRTKFGKSVLIAFSCKIKIMQYYFNLLL